MLSTMKIDCKTKKNEVQAQDTYAIPRKPSDDSNRRASPAYSKVYATTNRLVFDSNSPAITRAPLAIRTRKFPFK
jgi:hypothetical protein